MKYPVIAAVIVPLSSILVSVPVMDAMSAAKQGGGAFTIKKPAKKKLPEKRKKVIKKAPEIDYSGEYRGRFVLIEDNTDTPCWSGTRKFEIRNNRTRLTVLPIFGDTLEGRVSGGSMSIHKVGSGLGSTARWRGNVRLPASAGRTGVGKLQIFEADGGCEWRLEVTRLN